MSKSRRQEVQFGVLDALRVASLPDEHLVPAVASQLLNHGAGLPDAVELAHEAAQLLTSREDKECELAGRIIDEIRRQVAIKVERIRDYLWNLKISKIGGQLDLGTRVNRVCRSVFGPPEIWLPAHAVGPRLKDEHFNWFHRTGDGVRVAGFDASAPDELVTGFVYREMNGKTRYCLLPSRAKSVGELLPLLGLHPRLLHDKSVEVDWSHKSFRVGKINRLPWVMP